MLFVAIPQQTDVEFSAFWQSYPVHKARRDAEKAWRQVKGASHLTAILDAIELQKLERLMPGWHPQWAYPASWLRAARWEDEVALSARVRLAEEPCPLCGYPEPRYHSLGECQRMQQQVKIRG